MKKIMLSTILMFIVMVNCGNQHAKIIHELQSAIDSAVTTTKGIGLAAAVIFPDGHIWTGASGISHDDVLMEPDRIFSAGSIGKMFTGMTIIQFCEEDKIGLDDPIYKYLDNYRNIDSTITIRQLLNHTSGLFDFADNRDYWTTVYTDSARIWSMDEMLRTFIKDPVFTKGEDWNYATTNYVLLRMLIQKISDKPIPKVYEDKFFDKLNMNNTHTRLDGRLTGKIAHSWVDRNNDGKYDKFYKWNRNAFASSIGGEIWTTAKDLAVWTKALIDDKKVISQQYYDEVMDFHSPCTGEDFLAGYGLGVCQFKPQIVGGLEAIGHAGNALGYGAINFYLPKYDITIALMDNTEKAEAIFSGLNNILSIIKETYQKIE